MSDDPGFSWALAIFLIGMFIAIGATLSVIAWQVFSTWRAKMAVGKEQAYRLLAESTSEALDRLNRQLEATNAELAALRSHTAELERLLKEV
jgi:hypothetical protein